MNPHLVRPTDEQFEGIIGLFAKSQQRELRRRHYGWDYEPVPNRTLISFGLAVALILIVEGAAIWLLVGRLLP